MNYLSQENIIKNSQIDKKYWVRIAILLSAFVLFYAKAFVSLFAVWWNSYTYSFGFLIPVISLYIVWLQKDRLKRLKIAPSYLLGLPVLIIAIALLISNTKGGASIQGFSLITAIIGIILLILGAQFLKAMWFPIAYLLFMVPFWDNLTEKLNLPFQNFSASLGTKMIQAIGIPVYRKSIYIELPNITLEVAKVCSGVNNLIAIVAIAIPLAYIFLSSWQRRIILVCSGIIISMLANSLRVALIGIFAYFNIGEVLHGPYHVLQALSVSMVGFIALFIGVWVLSRGDSGKSFTSRAAATEPSLLPYQSFFKGDRIKHLFFLMTVILILIGVYFRYYR